MRYLIASLRTPWFGGHLEDLKRKKTVFERHCEAEKRDPSTVLLTVGMGIVLAKNEREAAALLEKIPAGRRARTVTVTVPEAVDLIGEHIDAGFGGFTFSNQGLPTTDAIGLAGDLIKAVRPR